MSQKNHMAVYLTHVYGIPELEAELVAGFKAAGKKLAAMAKKRPAAAVRKRPA